MYEKVEKHFTNRAKPAEGSRRNRRITLTTTPEQAERLRILATLDGVSVNHEIEILADAEYTRRMKDKTAADAIAALEKLNPGNV